VRSTALRIAVLSGAVVAGLSFMPSGRGHAAGSLQSRIDAARRQEGTLQANIDTQNQQIASYHGRLADLEGELAGIQARLDQERATLSKTQDELRASRGSLSRLRITLAHDRRALARQLIKQYEAGEPQLVQVVLGASSLGDLLETAEMMRRVQQANTRITDRVRDTRDQVSGEVQHLAALEATQQRQAATVLSQRDAVAEIKLEVANRALAAEQARDQSSAKLGALRSQRASLERQQQRAQARALAAQSRAFMITTPGSAAAGGDGFFPAAGTDYTVGNEPELAARLDRLAHALHLHLIGLSGYRTPEHSVAVGGFPNDPHTHGEASDTPGVEGVPEAVLNQYGLTRPFGGAAEADHIQLA
jgi:septal ring factor EnvC (AmiA/AmiB activator)